ncbi:MAG: aldo/keto reductase [Acidobacteria bacterium]|nr:aldo/keto reductase [Acidobacteriota bacterium]
MRRRTFFQTTALQTTAAASMAAGVSQAATAVGDVPKRVFGKTGEKLTIVGQASGRFPMIGWDEAVAVTRRAYELGINYFDCARLYWNGRSEEVYAAALGDVRKKVFVTTKCHIYDKASAEKSLEASLKALKTDYIDLWQVHQVGEMKEVEQIFGPNGSLEVFVKARKEGKCRFIGFTGHRDPEVHLALLKGFADWDTILMPLNPADPAYLSFEKMVLPKAVERGMGIQAMKTTANSRLLHSITLRDCLSYVLSLPVHAITLGATTIGQIEDDVRIARSFKQLDETQLAAIRTRAARFKGPDLENWKRNTERAEAHIYRDGVPA